MKEARIHLPEILALLKKRGFVPMFDFDGVLAPIVTRPEDAYMSARTGQALLRLKKCCPVAIISGRTLESVREQAAIPGIVYAGSHGVELALGGKVHVRTLPKRVMKRYDEARELLLSGTNWFEGLIVEDKPHATAINYRALDVAQMAGFRRAARRAIAQYEKRGDIRVLDHLKTFEIIARGGWTKGEVATHIVKKIGKKGMVPIYIGDSLTDEDAFRALKSGITIRVGRSTTSAAKYFFKKREEVDDFIEALSGLRSK